MPASPLTDTERVTLLSTIEVSDLIRSWKENLEIDITNELSECENIQLYRCDETELLFFRPTNSAGSGWLYEQLQKFDWFYMPYKWEHDIALQDLKDCHDVLEVGCASGAFVDLALKAGLNSKGIELNDAAVKAAQDNGLPVESTSLEEFSKLNPASLDAVCSFQVLEHVPDPRKFIEQSLRCLKVGGKLIICVPNSESFLKYRDCLLDMPPHHMSRWSEATFRSLESLFPIRLERVLEEPLAKYHVTDYLKALKKRYRAEHPFLGLVLNRYTLSMGEILLNAGLRRHLKGQSIYVQFEKLQ